MPSKTSFRLRTLAKAFLPASFAIGILAGPATAQETPLTPPVDVLQVSGYLDPIMSNGISRAIDRAANDGAQALVLQMNIKGTVLDRGRVTALAEKVAASKVPVAIWVGPSGARLLGEAGQLVGVARVSSMAPGSRIGNFGEPLTVGGKPLTFGEATDRIRRSTLNALDARALGVLKPGNDEGGTAVLGEMIVGLDGVTANGVTLHTAREIQRDGRTGRSPSGATRFSKLGLIDQLMHTVASPPVAYLLLTIGLALLLFEFFTAGIGLAGFFGALCSVLACTGLAVLPTRWWAAGAVALAMVAFAIDVQAGIPRFWTAVGVVLFVLASLFLYDGPELSWVPLATAIAAILATFLSGMPSMVRTRFATPTIGREWMIGSLGEATRDIDPEGVVRVGEGIWRARTNRATPIKAGETARVVAIDGITLEVEPETGAARDYREHREPTK